MAFSLPRRPRSRALGWYGCLFDLFVLVVLFKLFVLLDFFGGAAFHAVIAHEVRTKSIERNNFVRIALDNRRARHSAHDAGVFPLGDRHSASGFDCSESFGSVVAHPSHQNSDGSKGKLLRDGMKQNIGGGTLPIHGGTTGENCPIAAGHPSNHNVPISSPN